MIEEELAHDMAMAMLKLTSRYPSGMLLKALVDTTVSMIGATQRDPAASCQKILDHLSTLNRPEHWEGVRRQFFAAKLGVVDAADGGDDGKGQGSMHLPVLHDGSSVGAGREDRGGQVFRGDPRRVRRGDEG
jgi:hypothetical protein